MSVIPDNLNVEHRSIPISVGLFRSPITVGSRFLVTLACYVFSALLVGCSRESTPMKFSVPEPAEGVVNSVELLINDKNESSGNVYEISASEAADIEMAFRADDENIETSAGVVQVCRMKDGKSLVFDSGSFQVPEERDGKRVIRVLLNSKKILKPGEYWLEVHFALEPDPKVPAASARLRVVE